MDLNQVIMLVTSLLFALGASWFLLMPFFKTEVTALDDSRGATKELLLQKESLLNALEDLESDKLSGVVTEEHYEISKKELLAETASCVKMLERDTQEI